MCLTLPFCLGSLSPSFPISFPVIIALSLHGPGQMTALPEKWIGEWGKVKAQSGQKATARQAGDQGPVRGWSGDAPYSSMLRL